MTYTITDGQGNTSTAEVIIGDPFYLQKGNFAGTLGNPGGGYITLATTPSGGFTGKLRVPGTNYTLNGTFSTSGSYSKMLGGEPLTLQFDVNNLTGEAFGQYLIPGTYNGVPFLAYHALYNSTSNPAPEVGKYTMLIPPPAQEALQQAQATATVSAGKITAITPTVSGSGYVSVPAVTITGGTGTGATATAIINNAGQVTGYTVTSVGKGYTGNTVGVTVAAPTGYPLGYGYATLTVTESGQVTIAGRLADGTSISDGVIITGGATPFVNQFPVYVNLPYKPAGSLVGSMTFADDPGASDCNGSLTWMEPQQSSGAFDAGGFTLALSATGSRYAAPPAGVLGLNLGSGSPNASILLNEQDWSSSISHTATVTPGLTASTNTVTIDNPGVDALKLTINAGSGSFTGSFIDPSTGKSTTFSGLLLYKQTEAAGYFVTPTEGGVITLTPSN